MDYFSLLFTNFSNDLSPGRMVESMILLYIIWKKIKPHLDTLEARLAGLEKAVQDGFKTGESRFTAIEDRLAILESKTKED